MPHPFVPPHKRPAWHRLERLAREPLPHLRDLLTQADPARQARLTLEAAGLRLDATRQAVTLSVLDALVDLARESGVREQADAQRRGEPVNTTEGRAALHVALRGADMADAPWGTEISTQVRRERERFLVAAQRLHDGLWLGHTGAPIAHVVNLGIGGSDLGPRMVSEALAASHGPHVRVHFVSNPDAWSLYDTLRHLPADRTLFVVQSKSFTTQETMTLAASARRWLADHGCQGAAQAAHLVAVTARPDLSAREGYAPAHTFGFWDWVGGRYSVWSAIGFALAVAIGADAFRAFLAGGHAMDRHFWEAPDQANMPLLMALLGVWNRSFLGCPTQAIAPYASRLVHFAPFVRQMDMESNGKRVHHDGSPVEVLTGPILWGGLGIEGQHAFFQLLHQGTHRVPVDFIGVESEDTPLPLAQEHHRVVTLNMRAQAQALAIGRDEQATIGQLRAEGLDEARMAALAPHRIFSGNVPSNCLWLPALTPHALGALVALYEHKVFCQAAIWGINPFDQWGVELGKTLARALEREAMPDS